MKFFKRIDLLIVAGILLAAGVGLFLYRLLGGNGPAEAQIYLESELVMTLPLHEGEDRTFSIPQRENVVFHLYPDGSIAFESSDCPDQICVRAGKLRIPGESAACLPNRLFLKIVSPDDSGELDLVV